MFLGISTLTEKITQFETEKMDFCPFEQFDQFLIWKVPHPTALISSAL